MNRYDIEIIRWVSILHNDGESDVHRHEAASELAGIFHAQADHLLDKATKTEAQIRSSSEKARILAEEFEAKAKELAKG